MDLASIPYKFEHVWAENAIAPTYLTTPIPDTAVLPAASQQLGFPPITAMDEGAGGVPPNIADVNGPLQYLSQWAQWMQAGGPIQYDATFSGWIGGYANGATLLAASGTHLWRSTVDNNVSDPDTGGANWTNLSAVGGSLSGVLPNPSIASNVSLPGSPTTTTQAAGDATAKVATTSFVNPGSNIAAKGHRKFADGLIMQWGMAAVPAGSPPLSVVESFDIPFPNAVFSIATAGETNNPPGISYTGLGTGGVTFWSNGGGGENISYIVLGN